MNCPSDGTTLLMSERQGVEIDYCPECRGVWLDRGELDKILERAKAESGSFATEAQAPAPQQGQYDDPRYDRGPRPDSRGYGDPRARKKKSPFEFLGDIFE